MGAIKKDNFRTYISALDQGALETAMHVYDKMMSEEERKMVQAEMDRRTKEYLEKGVKVSRPIIGQKMEKCKEGGR